MDMNGNAGYALDWEDKIEYVEGEYTLLPPGKYPFVVLSFERQNFGGTSKIPACKMAVLNIRVAGETASTTVKERIYLHTSVMWKLSEFFYAIGQIKKDGEAVKMNWNAVPGSTGMLELEVNEYTDKNGIARKNNRVAHFLPPEPPAATRGGSAPAWAK